jgi:hypothetical protein
MDRLGRHGRMGTRNQCNALPRTSAAALGAWAQRGTRRTREHTTADRAARLESYAGIRLRLRSTAAMLDDDTADLTSMGAQRWEGSVLCHCGLPKKEHEISINKLRGSGCLANCTTPPGQATANQRH